MGYLLDTNVLSELVRADPDRGVVEQVRANQESIVTAAVVWHELVFGVERMAPGKRRSAYALFLDSLRASGLILLPYDEQAAEWHAKERARLTAKGASPAFADGQIAAIAAVGGFTLVTNNVKHFLPFCGLDVVRWHGE